MARGCDASNSDFADLEDVVLRNIDRIAVAAFFGYGMGVVASDADRSVETVGHDVEPLEMVPMIVSNQDRLDVGVSGCLDEFERFVRSVDDHAFVGASTGHQIGVVIEPGYPSLNGP